MTGTSAATTLIPGKDAPLESTIERLTTQLKKIGFNVEAKSWLNPVPHVWSVHLQDEDCPQLFTNGKGATKEAALASALGEFFERLSTNYFWADFWLGPKIAQGEFVHYPQERWFAADTKKLPNDLLDEHCLAIYQREEALEPARMVDINSGAINRGICALPFVRQSDLKPVWFPINLVGNLFVSNGMAAGNNRYEAYTQALSEIFERAIKARILTEGMCPPLIPKAVLARYPKVVTAIEALEAAGFHVQARDASMGGRFPVINVTLLNPNDGGCFASFGAHPLFEVALERTVTELLQGRALDQLDVFPEPTLDLYQVSEPHNLETHFTDSSGLVGWHLIGDRFDFPFTDWNFPGTSEEQFNTLLDQLHDEGREVYIMDYQHLGVDVCRILVPGFSEIYPADDLLWDNNNQGIELRDALLELPELDRPDLDEVAELINESGFSQQHPVAALIGLVPGGSTFWKELRVGELRAMLCLALGEQEEALDLIEGLLLFGHLHERREVHYRCIKALLEITLAGHLIDQYRTALNLYFGAEQVEAGERLINGEDTFQGFAPAPGLDGLEAHEKLIEAYLKVQKAKKEHLSEA